LPAGSELIFHVSVIPRSLANDKIDKETLEKVFLDGPEEKLPQDPNKTLRKFHLNLSK